MSELELPALSVGDLSISTRREGEALALRFSGNADMRVGHALDGVLTQAHEIAMARGLSRVDIDFAALEFMNSSCFKSFVTWISNVRELDPDKRYAIRFLSNPGMLWQRRSLHALRCFAVDIITIDG